LDALAAPLAVLTLPLKKGFGRWTYPQKYRQIVDVTRYGLKPDQAIKNPL
jgi:hypothetical protein